MVSYLGHLGGWHLIALRYSFGSGNANFSQSADTSARYFSGHLIIQGARNATMFWGDIHRTECPSMAPRPVSDSGGYSIPSTTLPRSSKRKEWTSTSRPSASAKTKFHLLSSRTCL